MDTLPPATMEPHAFKSHFPRRIALAALCCSSVLWRNGDAFEMEMGAVTVQDTFATPAWTSVAFIQPFPTVPVVAALPTNQGGDAATIRIRNVTTTGFEILQVEPNANDGQHVQMDTAYIAVETGSHTLPDGSRLIVQQHATTSFVARFISTTWDTVGFTSTFAGTPAVVAQIQTMTNESQTPPTTSSVPFMDVAVRNVTTGSLQVSLERAETSTGTVSTPETIGIIAVENAVNVSFTDTASNTIQLQSLLTPRNIRGWDNGCYTNNYGAGFAATPLSVASANSRTGNNGGWVRRCSESAASLGLTVDEDVDNDAERGHTVEAAGIIAASQAFHANMGVDLLVSKLYSLLSDPYNGAINPKAIPNADIQYTIGVVNRGAGSPDTNTLVVSEDIDPGIRLCVTAACLAGGPILFDSSGSPVPPGVSLGTVRYSNNGGATYTYVPIPDADGFDAAVDAVEITMSGQMVGVAPAGEPSFELRMAARVN
jgi:MSHA biogenesis protein MshQ